jgi:hypothetical protein
MRLLASIQTISILQNQSTTAYYQMTSGTGILHSVLWIQMFAVTTLLNIRFEVFKAAVLQIVVFWVVASCSIAGEYGHLGGTSCLHLQGKCLCKGEKSVG